MEIDGFFLEETAELTGCILAGVTNGQDMVAAYLHEKFQTELADLVCAMAEVGDRGQEYDKGKVSNASWWVWLIFRSWWKGKSEVKAASRE
jgi:hypothetical protein